LSVGFFVHIRAVKTDIQRVPASELPALGEQLIRGAHYMLAILLLIVLLGFGFSPTYSVCIGIGALVAVSFIRKESRMSWTVFLNALESAALKAIPVSAACAAAGIVVGAVGLTGLGLKFSAMVISVAGGYKIVAIVLVMLASLFLGMGLPVTAAYVVLAVLAVPGLKEIGISALAAHLIVMWYSQDSNITPPVCLAAYAAAGISGADPMKTGLQSWALAKGLYLIPLLFVYSTILTGGILDVFFAGARGAIGLMGMTLALEGFLARPIGPIPRILFICVTVCCYWADPYVNATGVVLAFLLVGYHFLVPKVRARVATL
jgi:TRAP transporter 4TM/12TM fusion protein